MKTIFKLSLLLFFLGVGFCTPSFAQYKPLKVNLDESGEKYIRFITWHQLWLSHNSEDPSSGGMRMSIRRSRFLAYAQVSPRFLLLTHFGLNNLGARNITANPNGQPDNQTSLFFLHDAWAEFAVVDKKLHIGTGLHYWNGISRLTNQSTLNMMTLDNPGAITPDGGRIGDARLFPWSTITTSDQFARHLGIYAKGTLGKFAYRVSANNARANGDPANLDPNNYTFQVDGSGDDWLYAGYFKVDIFDSESDKLPYFVGTYLGKKKVLSIGAGINYQPDALARGTDLTTAERQDIVQMAADVFYDAPVGSSGGAINALAAFYNYDFGDDNFAGGGLVPGSGNIIYGQVGFLLPFEVNETQFMPYVTYSSQNFEATPETSYEFGAGLNWFIMGHHAKITAEYNVGKQGVPDAETTSLFRLQTHIFL